MGLFRRRQEPSEVNVAPGWTTGEAWLDWGAPRDVIREGAYQEAIARICGPTCAYGYLWPVSVTLVREPDNQHDRNAIRAEIEGVLVGYLARDVAAIVAPVADRSKIHRWAVAGLIRGGSTRASNYGVHLWMDRLTEPGAAVNFTDSSFAVSWPPMETHLEGAIRQRG